MKPQAPGSVYGTNADIMSKMTNEIRHSSYASAVNTDEVLVRLTNIDINIVGLRKEIHLLAEAISSLANFITQGDVKFKGN